MMTKERLLKITAYLEENQTATLAQLSKLNAVSLDTVRRDLTLLEAEGVLRKVRGGAVWSEADVTAALPETPETVRKDEKQEIASLLAPYISDGMAIALSGGSTCTAVASFLAKNYYRLVILTNNLHALEILSEASTFTVIVPGGIVDTDTDEVFGKQCEEDIAKYNFDVAIIGAYAVSAEKGLSDDRFYQGGIVRAMLRGANQKILVADSSKFSRTGCINICPIEKLKVVLSDRALEHSLQQRLLKQGVQVVTPGETELQTSSK